MSFQDKSLRCADCGATFTFTSGEQEFYQTKGYVNEPRRCQSCRQAKKSERGGSGSSYGSSSPRQMFPATCAQCGKATEVPFAPRGDKPVYCSDCFRASKSTR
jgi:CxxC-x17-CxxC domain-containing protein